MTQTYLVALGVALLGVAAPPAPQRQPASIAPEQIEVWLANQGPTGVEMSSIGWSTSGFSIAVFSPPNWIRNLQKTAKNEKRLFDASMLTDEDRLDVWHVTAFPNRPGKVKQADMGSSVAHVVLTDKSGKITIQPVKETPFDDSLQSVGGATLEYHGLNSLFLTSDVMELWGKNRDQDFIISVVGVGGQSGHDFEVKPKHFPLLR